jgi:hypothetical protein
LSVSGAGWSALPSPVNPRVAAAQANASYANDPRHDD